MTSGRTTLIVTCILVACWNAAIMPGFIQLSKQHGEDAHKALFTALVLAVSFSVMYIVLGLILLFAASTERGLAQARTWFIGTCMLFVVRVVVFVQRIITSGLSEPSEFRLDHLVEVATLLAHMSALSVLHNFMCELKMKFKNENGASGGPERAPGRIKIDGTVEPIKEPLSLN